MLSIETKRKIDTARDVLVGKIPNPQAQIEQITTALIYKFMDDMDEKSKTLGGKARFFVGEFEKYSWRTLLDPRIGGQERMNLYSEAVQRLSQNANLPQIFRDVFKDAFVPYRDPETLSLFLKEINWFDYHHSEELGNAYEYLLSIMSSQGDAGQFRTPRHIIDFIVEAVDPQKDETVLDPACGTAGFLISAYKHIIGANDGLDDITGLPTDQEERLRPEERAKLLKNFHGYDIDPGMVRLSLVNMYLHGFVAPNIEEYDSLTYEDRWNDDFNVILANPPFMTPKGGVRPHKRFQIQANRAEVLFVDYIAEHLKPQGRAGIVVPEGIIFQSGTAYKALRKMLIEEQGLWAVVSLPAGVFQPYSGVKTSVLLLDKSRAKQTDEVLFVEVEHDGTALGASRKTTDKNDIPNALGIIQSWKNGNRVESNLATYVKKSLIASNSYNLSQSKYTDATVFSGEYQYVTLGELITQEKARANDKSLPVWSVSNKRGFVKDGSRFKHKIASDDTSNYKLVDKDFFAYNPSRINVGSIALNSEDSVGIVSPMYEVFSVLTSKINPEYLFSLLKSVAFSDYVAKNARGGVRQQLKFEDLAELKIPLPPLEVQLQLSEELSKYQRIITGAEQIISSWKISIDIKPEWERVALGEVATVIGGYAFKSSDYTSKGVQLVKMGNVKSLNFDYKNKPTYLPNRFIEEFSRYKLNKGDILISMTGTVGKEDYGNVCIVDNEGEYLLNQRVGKIEPKINIIERLYLYYYANTDEFRRSLFANSSGGVRQANISNKGIESVLIALPPIEVQKAIVAEVSMELEAINANKSLIRTYTNKIQAKIAEVWGE